MVKTMLEKLRSLFRIVSSRVHSPSKAIISRALDAAVAKKLSDCEVLVRENFRKWYRQSIVNVAIVFVVIVAGLLTYVFTDTTGLLKLSVAVAYLFSICVFLYRRVLNVRAFVKYREDIRFYSGLCLKGLIKYPYGSKMRGISNDVYLAMYEGAVSARKRNLHAIAARLRVVPNNDEIFGIVYARFAAFYRDVIRSSAIKFLSFVTAFAVLGAFVKNLVLLEMHFGNVFETISYPILYFANLAGCK